MYFYYKSFQEKEKKGKRAGTYSRNSVMYLRLHLDHVQGLVS